MERMLIAMIVFVLVPVLDVAGQRSIFEFDGRRPREVVVTIGEQPPREVDGPAMAQRLQGVLATWRGRELGTLLAAQPREPRTIGMPPEFEVICVLHLSYGRDAKRVRLVRSTDGTIVAHDLDDETAEIVELDRLKMGELLMGLHQFRGSFDELDAPRQELIRIDGVATPGWIRFDEDVLDGRLRSPSIRFVPTTRYIEEEGFHVRLPRDYDPRTPAGLVIWISPTPSGEVPRVFNKALDELNLICIGADNSENQRAPADRFQLAFDGMATVMRRYHVDPRRVYVTGFSGGGRMASMMHGAFADMVSGSVPIGGANSYKNVPIGDGRYWPAGYRKPPGRIFGLFRRQRMACITGNRDFNYENVQGVVRSLRADGVNAKVVDIEGLAHTLPDEDGFHEAIVWVDEPYREMRSEEIADATQALETYRQRFGDADVADEGQRRLLLMVMQRGAWTDAAWQAAEILGLPAPSGEKANSPAD